MAVSSRIRDLLISAYEGYEDFLDWYARGFSGSRRTADSVVDGLRRIPASDTERKRKLAEFFQTEAGARYSASEKEAAYNDLLGRERNKENRG